MATIIGALNQVLEDEVVLPAIQREFVWSEDQTERLLDSVMRGYPVGIALLWETYENIQYRSFVKDYRPGVLPAFADNTAGRRIRVVLDGQQRLQSLFVALFGTREGKRTYFDVLSGQLNDDVAEDRYFFYTLKKKEVREWNAWAVAEAKKDADDRDPDFPQFLVCVSDLFAMGAVEQKNLVQEVAKKLRLSTEDMMRVDLNLATFDQVLTKDQTILHVATIDENLPSSSPQRKSDSDVLEIFVRINREGTRLSRSDLIFSMLKLNWKESSEGLPEFVASINKGNSFDIDTDFVVRCLFAVSDLGTRLEVDLFRKRSNVQKLRQRFDACCDSIRAAVDFVQNDCRCQSSTLLGSVNTLVPVVYYLYHTKNHEVPNGQVDNLRSAIFGFGLGRPFTQYVDSRSGTFINSELRPIVAEGSDRFPLDAAIARLRQWTHADSLETLIQRNHRLALHLVQGLSGAKVQYDRNNPEIDHIFPRSVLKTKKVSDDQVNSFANFWILAQGKNRNKSSRHPREYFADVSDTQLRRALIDRDLLDYRRFGTFIRNRKVEMIKKVERETGLNDSLFS